jgi:hypothetical protein
MRKTLVLALLLLIATLPVAAQSLTGIVTGTVLDDQGGVLPGATVTLVGKAGSRSTTTDAEGNFRFPAVDPGTYAINVELSGFRPKRQENVVVGIGRTADINIALGVGGVTETVDVVGESPVVDVASSSTDNTLSQDLLFNLPIRPDNAATDLLDYLPGVNSGSAFGANENYGNALLLDGVDTRDPSAGSAWTFFNFNLVEEVQVGGLGAPAEFGAYTGAVVNTVTKSGGNRFSGLFDVYWTKESFFGDNIEPGYITQNPTLADPSVTEKKLDLTAQLSGPIIQDKLFFFVAAQRFEVTDNPSGAIEDVTEVSPRFNTKLTWLPGPNDNLSLNFQWDNYNVKGRCDYADALCSQQITVDQDSPEAIWGLQWRHLFGTRTFTEVKYTGWWGYYYLDPQVPGPISFDGTAQGYSGGAGYTNAYDRTRNQLNASISHYAEAFGKHDLKFGVEIERSKVRDRLSYVDGISYYDLTEYYPKGQYLAYDYGYDSEGRNERESVYAQDSWKPTDRLTINAGVRVDFVRGKSVALDKKVYSATSWAPRLGFAFDLTGDSKTVLKAHYGQYYDGIYFDAYQTAAPGFRDYVTYAYDPAGEKCGPLGNCFTEIDRSPSLVYRVDPDIKHPRVDEWTAGVERELFRDVRLSVTGILRDDKNVQASVYPDARWTPTTVTASTTGTDPSLNGKELTVYRWENRSASENNGVLTNVDGFQYLDPNGAVLGTARTERKYKGLMLVLDKRFSNRWQGRVSYVYSKSEGYLRNNGAPTYGQETFFETPTLSLVNSFGPTNNDRPHELKVFGTWLVPKIEVNLSGYYRFLSGRTYTPFQRFGTSAINWPTSAGRQPFLEPRGSRRLENESYLDLRIEKIFEVSDFGRISVFTDIQNVFNASTVDAVNARYPNISVAGFDDPIAFEGPTNVVQPRRFLLGARWSF